jgi:hypothetical protein
MSAVCAGVRTVLCRPWSGLALFALPSPRWLAVCLAIFCLWLPLWLLWTLSAYLEVTDAGGAFALHRTTEHWSQRAICFLRWPNWQFWSLAPGRRVLYGQSRADATATAAPRIHHARFRSARFHVGQSIRIAQPSSPPRSGVQLSTSTGKAWPGPPEHLPAQVGRSRHAHTQAITQQESGAWWSNKGPNFGALAFVEGSAWPSIYSMLQLAAGGALSLPDPHTSREAGDDGQSSLWRGGDSLDRWMAGPKRKCC